MALTIVYDHQIFNIQKYGGISRYFCEIAARLSTRPGNKVEIIAPFYVNAYFAEGCGLKPFGIKVPFTSRLVKEVNKYLPRLLLKGRRDVDVFHETYYGPIDNCPPSAKRVVTVYDMIHEKFAESFPVGDKTRQYKALAVKRADHVICISQSTKKDLMALLDVPEEKISVVHLGYSLLSGQAASLAPPPERPYLLYVGNRDGHKNFVGLLHAYALSARLRKNFSIVCFGGGGFREQERATMLSLKIPEDVVQWSGSDDVLANLYASAAAFVYPSLYEGFGIPPLEAMSFGCPVVCSNTSSMPEVVGEAAESFDPGNVEEMSSAIEHVLFSPERRETLVKLGLERLSRFSWEKCALDTLEVYEKIV
ncbi:MAG TPA: glycosyltransferase family 1 protein [Cyanobacteria bacterium UBA8530]|nr:glycosyltransferase family 1 protein [Cyanobacteria bacterium UBA8530]